MAIWNLGSINVDYAYAVPHIPAPGETLAAMSREVGLGGKGANMSVACARAGAVCHHIGAIGVDGLWTRDRLTEYGVDTRFIMQVDAPTGHAIITVAQDGENAITILPGANHSITDTQIDTALSEAATGDWLLMQNETNGHMHAAQRAGALGLRVAYAAAPFDAQAASAMLPFADLLILNAVEMQQLHDATGQSPDNLDIDTIIVTKGSTGSTLYCRGAAAQDFASIPVDPVDTTGAGDTFTGYVLASLDRGFTPAQAISLATRAGALMVTRQGTADVIPDLREVEAFRTP